MHRRARPLRISALFAIAAVLAASLAGATRSDATGDPPSPPLLSDEEIAAIAGDLPGSGAQRDSFGAKIAEALTLPPVSPAGTPATQADLSYGEHPRMRFDLWQAQSPEPTPLAIFLHGGGFRRGDKALLYQSRLLDQLLEAGISVVGVNYRLSHQNPEGTLGSLRDIARFVQWIRHHADDYAINPDRIAAFGGSAGGAASLWLAFRDDLADPDSDDPVARQSSRLACAGAMATPATLDLLQWQEILGVTYERILAAAASFGVADESDLHSAEAKRIREETDLLALLSADDPPFYMHNNDSGETPRGVGQMAHHPNHARVLKAAAEALGVEAVVYAPRIGIEDPSGENLVAFFKRHLEPGGVEETAEETAVWRHEELRRFPAKEAHQGVAVDAEHFYAITNRAIGKYRKSDGERVGGWEDPKGGSMIHLNAGLVIEGRLYAAHSNFPRAPWESSLEIWDVESMEPLESRAFEDAPGSLTWIVPDGEGWLACFAHYRRDSDPALSRVVRFDGSWDTVASWTFPADLIERFAGYSASCGAYGPEDLLFVTGHDARELYVLAPPDPGRDELEWIDTIEISAPGQAFAWDPSEPGLLYAIERRTREVIVSRVSRGEEPAP